MKQISSIEMKNIVKAGYNLGKYAKYFGKNKKLSSFEKIYFNSLIKNLSPKSNILDLGCGTGLPFDSYLIANGHNVIGIDIAEKQIEQAQINLPEGNYILGDFTKYKFNNNSVNAVIALYSIFHIPKEEHKIVLKMIYDYLLKDGYLLITMGVGETAGIEIDNDFCGKVEMAWSNYNSEKNIELIHNNGFDIIKYDNEADYGSAEEHLWILAKKLIL